MKSIAPVRASDTAELLANVADEFLQAAERGEKPDIEEFAQRYPEIAPVLRDVLPALVLMNPSGSGSGAARAPAVENMSDRTLGDFRLIREIGRGGMGVVYEAEQISLSRTVALKVLPFAGVLDARQLTRFRNEARAAAALHHNNIVPVYSVGCERGVHYYAMQLIEGSSLARVIAALQRPEGSKGSGVENGECSDAKLKSCVLSLTTEHRQGVDQSSAPLASNGAASSSPLHTLTSSPFILLLPIPLTTTSPLSAPVPTKTTSATSRSWAFKQPRRSITRTSKASFIVISSRRTCCSTKPAGCGSPISAWLAWKPMPG